MLHSEHSVSRDTSHLSYKNANGTRSPSLPRQFLFRTTEAMELAAPIRCLKTLLAPTRTTQHLLPGNRLRQRLYIRALNYDFERRSPKTKRRPNLHFFNPLIELLSLDAIIKRSWTNMALNLSPELRNTIRFLQLIVRRDEKWQNGHPR
jgi:hypothetical protein